MKEFNFLIKNYKFDLIQVPLNVFNKDFLNKKFKNEVLKKNIKVHVRSVFLQGVLTNHINYLPNKFKRFKTIVKMVSSCIVVSKRPGSISLTLTCSVV